MRNPRLYDIFMFLVLWAGVHQGLVPLAGRLFGWRPWSALALRLPDPASWLVSAAIIVVACGALVALDGAKKRRHPSS